MRPVIDPVIYDLEQRPASSVVEAFLRKLLSGMITPPLSATNCLFLNSLIQLETSFALISSSWLIEAAGP